MPKKKTLEERYDELDDAMQMYFRYQTLVLSWNKSADKKNEEAREYNRNKRWWQISKPDNFPHYHATPIQMPNPFPVPPSTHPDYKKTKKLIEDYVNEVPNE